MKLPAALFLLAAAAPGLAQSSGCVRDASGALLCAMRPAAPAVPNPGRRLTDARDLSAAALARSRAQLQAMNEVMAQQQESTADRARLRHELACPGSPPPATNAAATARAC